MIPTTARRFGAFLGALGLTLSIGGAPVAAAGGMSISRDGLPPSPFVHEPGAAQIERSEP